MKRKWMNHFRIKSIVHPKIDLSKLKSEYTGVVEFLDDSTPFRQSGPKWKTYGKIKVSNQVDHISKALDILGVKHERN